MLSIPLWASISAVAIFVAAYLGITFEHKARVNKSSFALLAGSFLWVLAAVIAPDREAVGEALAHETQEIFGIVIFLLSAMTIVETLIHYGLFDWLQEQINRKKLTPMTLFWILGAITFFLSALLDNLTTALIMLQIGRKMYRHQQSYLLFACAVVIAANAGGAFSPIGDVTTIMLWLAEKFSATQVMVYAFLPSLAAWLIPQYLLSRKIRFHEEVEKEHAFEEKNVVVWKVIVPGLCTFALPVLFSLYGLPPFLGMLTGLGVLWLVADRVTFKRQTSENGTILQLIQKADIATLKFFIGILLAVGALGYLGILHTVGEVMVGNGSVRSLIQANIGLGALSAILDNVPLVAAAISIFNASTPVMIWILLAITAGVGGSMLVIGSAAGVAAMGQAKGLTFGFYLKHATIPAVLGFAGAIAVWGGIYALTQ